MRTLQAGIDGDCDICAKKLLQLRWFSVKIYKKNACYTCHSIDGSKMIGPSFKGIWGTSMNHTDGSVAVVDENYIRESILEPQAKIVNGYQPVMPSYKSILRDREIQGVIEYIKSLK